MLKCSAGRQDNKPKKNAFLFIASIAVLIIATGIFCMYRFIIEEGTPHAYNGHTETDNNDISHYPTNDTTSEDSDYSHINTEETQYRNLQKLSKVWGFAKYTHQTFLLGERCWDEELLALIPIVRFADEDDVNDILYNWFIGLGDDGYDLDYSAFRLILLENFPNHRDIIVDFFEDINNHNWPSVEELHENLWLLDTGFEMNHHPMADLSWVNEDYLGVFLAAALSQFNKVQVADREMAPVFFDSLGNSVFTNKERFVHIDYTNCNYRLLGLFRLWNTVKYFFPYLDIIDYDWNEILFEYIRIMLEGADQHSYEVTLVTMASRLRDVHILFFRETELVWPLSMGTVAIIMELFDAIFGTFYAPVNLSEAEGHLVVNDIPPGIRTELIRGDLILRVNERDISEIVADMLQYLPYPNTEKALAYLVRDHVILRQHSNAGLMAVDVYRQGEELRVYVNTFRNFHFIRQSQSFVPYSHMLLDNNIGLVNPLGIEIEETYRNAALREIMSEFKSENINGLIIDLRQFSPGINYLLAEYLINDRMHFVTMSNPFEFVPGVFVDGFRGYSGYGALENLIYEHSHLDYVFELNASFGSYFHGLNVVLIMNENTQSHGEQTVMTLRGGDNVTVLGTNSIGANGNIVLLPLPGEILMIYTGLGVYTTDGGQTQRIGLSPDIYVPRTIVGISDGRDEQLEAAIQFLIEQMSQNE